MEQANDLAETLKALDDEFALKKRLSDEQEWCTPISQETKTSTVRAFYNAFHDKSTLSIRTCAICYRKWAEHELWKLSWDEWLRSCAPKDGTSPFGCGDCFPQGMPVSACAECVRCLGRDVLSPAAQLHGRLGCEHMFPEELKGLTPMEEKLIGLNSCYGFFATYTIPESKKQTARYPRHVKGHITVFPNNVQELATKVLPHPLVQAMEEIHVSWHGPEKPAPRDLSGLLSVRRRVVERALVWLRENNPHYAEIVIDTKEMDGWDSLAHGVPSSVYDQMEHNEPSSWERTRTAHVVPPADRAMEDDESQDIDEIFDMLSQAQDPSVNRDGSAQAHDAGDADASNDDEPDETTNTVNEVTSSAMFALDRPPDVADIDKLHFAFNATQGSRRHGAGEARASVASLPRGQEGQGDQTEPYIHISRGDDFADSFDAAFFAKAFPALLPFGFGGPRLAEEATALESTRGIGTRREAEGAVDDLISSRNMSLRRWAAIVLRRHGGRFASHHIFSFLVFNMGVRSRNRRISMLSVAKKNFAKVQRIVQSLTVDRLVAAKSELEETGKTSDVDVKELLKSLSLYGYRQPMSREARMSMRHKILALIIRYGVPAIWFTVNPNDITNPVKLRLADLANASESTTQSATCLPASR
ncbi:TPR domain-containing protein [Purpureocillium lavendulum]|uniref:TPR domain-containing protein n=1 Tax=Purpureocillium lavendulum TaxID=1247861 RepID=A0AB34FD98_9HYPO|nr:TPR domain-containing protein [Purpureocillium lavendulum]